MTHKRKPLRAICITCGEDRPLYNFAKDDYSASGHRAECKECAPSREHGPEVTRTQREFGVTVPQENGLISAAWAEAMDGREFNFLRFA